MLESENNYHLYDLESGERCTVSYMLNDRVQKEFYTFFKSRIGSYASSHSIQLNEDESNKVNFIDVNDFSTIFETDGIQFTSKTIESLAGKKIFISWTDIQTYLKIAYIQKG
ncbi:MAG: hypothetical protein P8P87_01795 [Crocinitomicaceae bacterium]|nr:hypothetical protein [Crocinitomicaceae bacterium]